MRGEQGGEEQWEVAPAVTDDELKQLGAVPVSKQTLEVFARMRDARLLATERAKLARAEADELRARGERPEALLAAIEQVRNEVAELRSRFEVAEEGDRGFRRDVGAIEMRLDGLANEVSVLRPGPCPKCGGSVRMCVQCHKCRAQFVLEFRD